MQSLTCAIFASYPVVRKETTAGSHDFRGSFGRRPLGALVGLYESLQDLGDLALEGKTVGRDDLGAQALQADVPEIFFWLLLLQNCRCYKMKYCSPKLK